MMAKCEYMGKSEKKKNIDEPTSNVHNSTYIFNIQSAIKKNREMLIASLLQFFLSLEHTTTNAVFAKSQVPWGGNAHDDGVGGYWMGNVCIYWIEY